MTAVRRGEAGYNLVMLVVAITVLNIAVAAALPLWSQAIRRDKERELISRGLQYAEGIRLFQQRFGRLPVRLEELVEVEPRCIRRLWKDPLTEDGKWVPVFAGHVDGVPPPEPPDGREPGRTVGGDPTRSRRPDPDEEKSEELDPNAPPQAGDVVAVGPIIGVRSKSSKDSILTFLGQTRYDRWIFRADVFGLRPNPLGNPNVAPTFDPNWWRPYRGGIVAPGLQQMPPPGAPPPPPPGGRQRGSKPPSSEPD
jgi:type II secretory pathway pseudopilin PulG